MDEITFVNSGYNVSEPPNIHFHYTTPRHLFLYFQSGVIVNGKEEKAGNCIIYAKDSMRDYKTQADFVNSYVSFTAPPDLFNKLNIKPDKVIYPSDVDAINDIIFKICDESSTREHGYEEKFKSLILDLLVTLARGINQKSNSHKNSDLKNLFLSIRTEFLSDVVNPPSFDKLLTRNGVSRTQGYKLYTTFFHTSPKDDLIWARLQKARGLISHNPDIKIYEVVTLCGFSNPSHFFRTFRQRYGYTPKDYANAVKGSTQFTSKP